MRVFYSAGMKIQREREREREQNQLPSFSDQKIAAKLSMKLELRVAAVQNHGARKVADLFASPGEPASSCAEDENLDWLRSLLHQVEGKAGMVLQAHLIEG